MRLLKLLALVFPTLCFSQSLEFIKDLSSLDGTVYSMRESSDGNLLIAGTESNLPVIYKSNFQGNILWKKTHTVNSLFEGVSITTINEFNNGNIGCLGNYSGIDNQTFGLIFLMLNSFGDTLWTKIIADSSGFFRYNSNFTCTHDNGFAVVFFDLKTNFTGLMKFDHLGNLLWRKDLSSTHYTICSVIKSTYDNGFILGGTRYPFAPNSDQDSYIAKIDVDGNVEWETFIEEWAAQELIDLIQTRDGNFVFTSINSNCNSAIEISKIDINGNMIWSNKSIFSNGIDTSVFASSLYECNDGGYVLCGNRISYLSRDFMLFKTDSAANLIWEYSNRDEGLGYSVLESSNVDEYFACGYSYDSNSGQFSPVLYKVNSKSTSLIQHNNLNFSFYPNPTTNLLIIEFDKHYSNIVIKITNAEGRLMDTRKVFNEKEYSLNISHLSKGHYYFTIETEQGVSNVKFIKQ